MTSLIATLEFSRDRHEWQVFLPERTNTHFLSKGVPGTPTDKDKQGAKDYLILSGFDVSKAGWQQDVGDIWTIEVRRSQR